MARPVVTDPPPVREVKHAIRLLHSARGKWNRYTDDPLKAASNKADILEAESTLERLMVQLETETWYLRSIEDAGQDDDEPVQ